MGRAIVVTGNSVFRIRGKGSLKVKYAVQYLMLRLARFDQTTGEIFFELWTNPMNPETRKIGDIHSYGFSMTYLKNSMRFDRFEDTYDGHSNIKHEISRSADVNYNFLSNPDFVSLANIDGNSSVGLNTIPFSANYNFHNLDGHNYLGVPGANGSPIDYKTYNDTHGINSSNPTDYSTFDYSTINAQNINDIPVTDIHHYVDSFSVTWDGAEDPNIEESFPGKINQRILTMVFKLNKEAGYAFENKNVYHGEGSYTLLNEAGASSDYPMVDMNMFGKGVHVCLAKFAS